MKRLVTILRNDKDRSYIDDLLEVISYNENSIIFRNRNAKDYRAHEDDIRVLKENIKSMSNAEFFKTKLPKNKIGFKRIMLSVCKSTGDRSYSGESQKMIAENNTHFQIIVKLIGLNYIKTLCKHEYDIRFI